MDVDSLFTNVPLQETINIICRYITEKGIDIGLPLTELERLLYLCTSNVQFNFQGQLYQQIDGIIMGTPLGPILADIFMSSLEDKIRPILNDLDFFGRYVDDILVITRDEAQTKEVFDAFNLLHPNITVKIEHEHDGTIPFLDLEISRRNDGSIKRSIYRKKTWTGQYMHFCSFVPLQYKRNLVKALFNRARRICTDDTIEEELNFLKSTLISNGYPAAFVAKHSRNKPSITAAQTVPKQQVSLQLPFKGDDVTRMLIRRLRSTVARTYYAAEPIVFYKTRRIPTPPIKEQLPLLAKSHILYLFQCRCSATYVGLTERQLKFRISEHIPTWVKSQVAQHNGLSQQPPRPRTHKLPASAIARHLLETNHQIDPSNSFRVIHTSSNSRLLHYAEVIAIRKFQPPLCVQKTLFYTTKLPW
jgi:hypothetical protein